MAERLIAFALLLVTLTASAAQLPVPPGAVAEAESLRVLGQGRMRWFGLLLYDASLWVPDGRFSWDRGFALDIRYARDFEGRRLAEASVDELRRIGLGDAAQWSAWGESMRRAFPDVRKGEHITGVYRPGVGVDFFHEGRATATVADPAFARAFFSIWLDPRTREPRLRAALLGQR